MMNTDDNFLGTVKSTKYYNMITKPSMVYYFNTKMYSGVFVDIHSDKLVINRNVYSLTAWLGEVGGF